MLTAADLQNKTDAEIVKMLNEQATLVRESRNLRNAKRRAMYDAALGVLQSEADRRGIGA